MALNKRANEMYIVYIGQYSDRSVVCVTEEYSQAVTARDQINSRVDPLGPSSDMTAEIETIRAFRKGQRIPKDF